MKEEFDSTARSLFDSLLSKSFEKEVQEDDAISAYYAPPLDGLDASCLPLLEEEDRDILMHRDAHFAKNFEIMLKAYEDESTGAVLDVAPHRIRFLMELEEQLGQNLAPYLLQGRDAEKVAESIALYKRLRDINEPLAASIADLILSEDDTETAPSYDPKIIPYLIQLINTPLFYDILFPGYGQAPIRACIALGKLKATSAIKPLFELLGSENFDVESASLQALSAIGNESRKFCLDQLASRPITKNNERAAILCSSLELDDTLAEAIITQLEDPDIQKREPLATYLVLAVQSLPKKFYDRFRAIMPKMTPHLQQEMKVIIK